MKINKFPPDRREPMRSSLRVIRLGLSVSSVLAVPYVLVMITSLLLIGRFTTGSWQAAFLGIGWRTLAGFEFGLLGVVILGFSISGMFVTVYHAFRRQVISQSKPSTRPGQYGRPLGRFWAFRLLAACLVLPALALVIMRVLAPVLSSGLESGLAGTNVEGLGVKSQPVNLGAPINTAHREAEPSFTADGQTMYYNCYNADICVSYQIGAWGGGSWTPPERLGTPISTEYQEVEPVINAAGDKLYFNSNRPDGSLMGIPFFSPFMNVLGMVNIIFKSMTGDSLLNGLGLGHVWVSYRIEGVWSEPRRLEDVSGEPPVNSAYHDHCLSFSADGNEAFWTSVRPGGFGGNDIWTSRRVDGRWSAPENLGPNVNGPGDEHHSLPTPDGKSLYVTTTRQDGYGGEDIYVTTRNSEGKWGPLVNLGPLVNGTGDDRCPAWTPDHKIFLFDSVRQVGFGSRDIWWVDFRDVIGYPHTAAHIDPAAPASVPQDSNGVVP